MCGRPPSPVLACLGLARRLPAGAAWLNGPWQELQGVGAASYPAAMWCCAGSERAGPQRPSRSSCDIQHPGRSSAECRIAGSTCLARSRSSRAFPRRNLPCPARGGSPGKGSGLRCLGFITARASGRQHRCHVTGFPSADAWSGEATSEDLQGPKGLHQPTCQAG